MHPLLWPPSLPWPSLPWPPSPHSRWSTSPSHRPRLLKKRRNPKGEGDPQAPKTKEPPQPPQQPVRMTPSEVRQARQLSRADRFHELLLANTMDL